MTVLKFALPLASFVFLGACAPPSPPTTSAAQTPPAAMPAAASASAPGNGQLWDVTQVRCSQLLGASDDDRAAAAMFYYGYHAARAAIRVIDDSKIDEHIHRVMEQCASAPDSTVINAFDVTFARAP